MKKKKKKNGWHERFFHRSILWRAVLHSVIISTITVGTLAFISYLFASALVEQLTLKQLSTAVMSAENTLERIVHASRNHTTAMANSYVKSLESGDVNEEWYEDFFAHQQSIDALLHHLTVYDSTGLTLFSAGENDNALPFPPPSSTVVIPHYHANGLESLDVIVPLKSESGTPNGWMVSGHALHTAIPTALAAASTIGESASAGVVFREGKDLLFIQQDAIRTKTRVSNLGDADDLLFAMNPVALSSIAQEGVGRYTDHNGNAVLSAYRYMPDLGWGLVASINMYEVRSTAAILTETIAMIGGILLLFSIIISFSFARKLTSPLFVIGSKMEKLGPGHWKYRRSVKTGDELQVLDTKVANLTSRLRNMYEHLEEEVKMRTQQLEEDYAKDGAILESITMGLLVLNKHGKIEEANPAAMQILKYEPKDMIGKSAVDLLSIREHQQPLSAEKNPILQCLKTKKTIRMGNEIHLTISCKDRSYLSVNISVSPLMRGRTMLGAIVLFQDVTTERQLDYMKTEFITLASHQLRTPLSTVQWYLELLSTEEQERLSEDQKSFVVELRLATHRMLNIVTELMDASRLRESGVTPATKRLDLRRYLSDLTKEMKPFAIQKQISFTLNLPSSAIVHTDPMLLNVILQNLFSNAIKYSRKKGRVIINLKSQKDFYTISVEDQGIGIPFADQERIFQKLFRAHNARKLEVNGSGLGLYSSKMIANKMGGDITFDSREDKGSVFHLTLPKKIEKKTKKKKS